MPALPIKIAVPEQDGQELPGETGTALGCSKERSLTHRKAPLRHVEIARNNSVLQESFFGD